MHRPARRAVARRTRRGPEPGGSAPAEGGKGIEPPPKGPARRAAFDRAFAARPWTASAHRHVRRGQFLVEEAMERIVQRHEVRIVGDFGNGQQRPALLALHALAGQLFRPVGVNRKQGRQWSCRSFRFAGNHHCSKCCNWPDLDKTNIANPGPAVDPPAVGTNRSRFLKPVGVETQCLAVLGNGADQVRGRSGIWA